MRRDNKDSPLDLGSAKLAANQTISVESGVGSIHCYLVLGGIANETLGLVKSNVRWGRAVALVVGISTRSFCQTPTQEYVVPKSMPTEAPSTDMVSEERRNGSVKTNYSKNRHSMTVLYTMSTAKQYQCAMRTTECSSLRTELVIVLEQ